MQADEPALRTTPGPPRPPGVVFWYRLYCGFSVALYALSLLTGLLACLFRVQLAGLFRQPAAEPSVSPINLSEPGLFLVLGGLSVAEGLVMGSIFLATFFLPRRPWAWVVNLIILALGLTGCELVFCLPLLIFWLRADNRTYFGCDKWLK
jgi:hypothetical protein